MQNVKIGILTAYLTYNDQVSKTLRPGIVSLTLIEFPDNWENLLQDLMNSTQQNPGFIIRFLKLLRDITNRYGYSARSDPLYKEIIFVCNQTHDYLMKLAAGIFPNCQKGDKNSLGLLRVLLKVFYNLNYQDLHPKFEDNLKNWMDLLKGTIKMHHQSADDDIFKAKGAAL